MDYCLHFTCPDQAGIIAAVAAHIAKEEGNILDLSQHTVLEHGRFLLRAVFHCNRRDLNFESLAEKFQGQWKLFERRRRLKAAIFVSKTDHCLFELLLKRKDGELNCNFPVVISNHPELEKVASDFDVPFIHVPFENQAQSEKKIQALLDERGVDFIILARYMRILSSSFIETWRHRIINIHHGFLPAFKGARPYHQAWEKGVKLIGATAHFASDELDQGPIIEQDTLHVPETTSVAELTALGKDVERAVLVKAVKFYLDHRVFIEGGRTFIL